jgi:hypothetical protein
MHSISNTDPTAVVSAATTSSAGASVFLIQQLKQQQQLNLKILFHLNLI